LNFSDPSQVDKVTPTEMAKVKTGSAIRLINRELVVDTLLPDRLNDHNQAVLEFFMSIQEEADKKLDESRCMMFSNLLTLLINLSFSGLP
jgi:hypothetical protein